jgi:tetratricopeptide (TPR) repeat protein
MLSSTYKELMEHREALRKAMLGQRFLPIAMEDDAALPYQDLIDASLAKVDESDAYVGLISYRYGQTPKDTDRNPKELSLTELEFHRAVERKIPICMFIMHDDHPVPRRAVGEERGAEDKYLAFVALAKKDRIYAEFKSADDLKAKAVQSLVKLREVLEGFPAPTNVNEDRTHPHALTNIPINLPRHFLGRDEELAAIDAALKSNNGRAAITALHGLRGVGKTTLAAAYAENHRSDYRAAWWIRAETESTIRADLVGLGVRLGWVAADATEEPALAAVLERLRDDGDGILLVFDNANQAQEVWKYFPRGGAAQIIVTSNAPDWRGIAATIEIEVWPNAVGADYLIERSGRDGERGAALALSETLGGLPLAHEQAAAYCERLGISLAEYTKRFAATPGRYLGDVSVAPARYHNGLTVAKTFELAIEEAAKLHPAAEPLIVHVASFAPEPIPLFLLLEARKRFAEPLGSLTDDGLDEAVAALRSFALIDREVVPDERDPLVTTDCVRLHRLVRQIAAVRREGNAREQLRGSLLNALVDVFSVNVRVPENWPRLRRLDPLAVDIVRIGDDHPITQGKSIADLLIRAGWYRQFVLLDYAGASNFFEKASKIFESFFGSEHEATSFGLATFGESLLELGEHEKACPILERALKISQKVSGPENIQAAVLLSDLANVHLHRSNWTEARSLFEQALAIYEKLGREDARLAATLVSFGVLLKRQGEPKSARSLFERGLATDERVFGRDHPEVAFDLDHLGGVLLDEGDALGSLPYFERALAIYHRAFGPEHPVTQKAATRILAILTGLRRSEDAKVLAQKYNLNSNDI